MTGHDLLMRLTRQRIELLTTMSQLPTSLRDPDAATSISDIQETFALVAQVSSILRSALAFPHKVDEKVIPQKDGSQEKIAWCPCGWFDFVDHEWSGEYSTVDEARAFHLDHPHLNGVVGSEEDYLLLRYWTGELAADAITAEESWVP